MHHNRVLGQAQDVSKRAAWSERGRIRRLLYPADDGSTLKVSVSRNKNSPPVSLCAIGERGICEPGRFLLSRPEVIVLKNLVLAVFVLAVLPSPAIYSQDVGELGGARRPTPDMKLKRDWQYKRVHQLALRYILLDRAAEAQTFLREFLDNHPKDAETHFLLGVYHAHMGDVDTAVTFLRKSVELGLPAERIAAGPRELFVPLSDHKFIRQLQDKYTSIPLHGPLVGNVTDHSASIWIRTAIESPVSVVVSESDSLDPSRRVDSVNTTAQDDFAAAVPVDNLKPETVYHYGVRIGDGPIRREPHWHFRTFPVAGRAAKFTLAFGGGAGFVPANERMWKTIGTFDPLALLLLGDNVYIDDPESPAMQRYTYYRRQSRPEWRELTAQSAVFSIWDDHDFSTNDSWGGPLIDKPIWKRRHVWPIFHQNWANPAYGGGETHPGCWYEFSIGDVDFFMLDCRYYRTNPRAKEASMLGQVQLRWLKDRLRESSGTFKVICSSVPWDFRTKGNSRDTWNGFRAEREAIFSFIEQKRIEGVLLMSADRHRSDAWQIERPDGYDFFEFNSSRLTNQHVHATTQEQGALFSYNRKQSFGLVSVDTQGADPWMMYDVITIDGEKVHSLKVRRSQLQFE